MADLGAEVGLRDDDGGAFNPVVDAGGGGGMLVDVLEAVGNVGSDLDAGSPGCERSEAGISRVAEAVGEAGAGNEFVDEIDVVIGEGGAEEASEAAVVGPAEGSETGAEGNLRVAASKAVAEGTLDDDGVPAAEGAAPGGGRGAGEALGEEVISGGAELREGVEGGGLREGGAEGGKAKGGGRGGRIGLG